MQVLDEIPKFKNYFYFFYLYMIKLVMMLFQQDTLNPGHPITENVSTLMKFRHLHLYLVSEQERKKNSFI